MFPLPALVLNCKVHFIIRRKDWPLRRHSPIAGAAVMCMMLKLPESERKRQDRFVRRAKKTSLPGQNDARSLPKPSPFFRSGGGGHRTGHKTFDQMAESDELAINRQTSWGMSIEGPVGGIESLQAIVEKHLGKLVIIGK